MSKKNTFPSQSWRLFSLVIGTLTLLAIWIVWSQHQYNLQTSRQTAADRLALIKVITSHALDNGRYDEIQPLFNEWGQRYSETLLIKLETKNGFELGLYQRPLLSQNRLELKEPVKYGYRGAATLTYAHDTSDVKQQFYIILLSVLIALGIAMIFGANLVINSIKRLHETTHLSQLTEQLNKRNIDLRTEHSLLQAVIDSLPDLIYFKSPNGTYHGANKAFCKFFGLSQNELDQKTDAELFDEPLASQRTERDNLIIRSNQPDHQELWIADKNHTSVLLDTLHTPYFDDDENLLGIIGIARDITGQRRVEQALRRSQKMDAIGHLTGGIAHDFNNILGVILGNLELLKLHDANADKSIQRINTIEKSAQRAADLTKQLLGFSRHQTQQLTITNINNIINEMDSLIVRSMTPEIEVEYLLAADLWNVAIDPGDFQDSLLNLALNARDAMAGSGCLHIETRNCSLDADYCAQNPDARPGDYVQLSVSDNGAGIAPEQQDVIFEPFYTTKELGKGTGLGLAMVYGFIQRSNGFLKVYSEPDIGTTFRLYFPRDKGEEQTNIDNQEQIKTYLHGTETLLVVDDEEDLLELARNTLESLGYRILTASNGQQALQLLEKEARIDLLFSDVVMPGGINGYELAEQASILRPELKVLLTSGYTEKAIAHNGQARFNTNLLSKPYTRNELAQRLRETLGN
ncbi:MAG: response regulator [Gammaproteobacteria bacterium]|nr:response regulator [Gammaproteobacteria bacterium]